MEMLMLKIHFIAKKLSFCLVDYNKSVIFAVSYYKDKEFFQIFYYEVFFIVSRT